MSILSSILDKLGLHKPAAPAASPAPAAPSVPAASSTTYEPGFSGSYGAPAPLPQASPAAPPHLSSQNYPTTTPVTPAPHTPDQNHPTASVPSTPGPVVFVPPSAAPAPAVPMQMVDVVSHLDHLAKINPLQGLNWKQSIHDVMFLLGLPHSPADIKELAVELGCPEKEMGDSYSRNVWTYQALMKKIAENGGNVPPGLLK